MTFTTRAGWIRVAVISLSPVAVLAVIGGVQTWLQHRQWRARDRA